MACRAPAGHSSCTSNPEICPGEAIAAAALKLLPVLQMLLLPPALLRVPPAIHHRQEDPGQEEATPLLDGMTIEELRAKIQALEKEMWTLSKEEKFEEAIDVRDRLQQWKQLELRLS